MIFATFSEGKLSHTFEEACKVLAQVWGLCYGMIFMDVWSSIL